MRPVNLMTKDAASSRSLPPVGTILAGAAPIVAIGVVAVGYSLTHGTVKKDQDRLAAVQAQVAALPVAHSTTSAFAALSVESNSRRSSRHGTGGSVPGRLGPSGHRPGAA